MRPCDVVVGDSSEIQKTILPIVADRYYGGDLLSVEYFDQIFSDQRISIRFGLGGLGGAAIAKLIWYEQTVPLVCEEFHLMVPIIRGRREAVKEQEGWFGIPGG